MHANRILLAAATFAALSSSARADTRMRKLAYLPDHVVRLDACFGFQTMVQFGPDERIENVGLGEASQWLVAPNKRANMLFVKPSSRTTHSNMTVATDRHVYAFDLAARDSEACRRGEVAYSLKFTYPQEPQSALPAAPQAGPTTPPVDPPAPAPEQRNAAYTFTGARENIPARVFDDGRATFFRWNEGSTTPAVYAIAADKSETLVNFTSRGDYLVIDQVAPAFELRRGNAVAVLYNDAYQTPRLDGGSPQPRAGSKDKRKGRSKAQ